MAYIIRPDYAYNLGKTEVGYFDADLNVLDAFSDQSVAYPGTIIRATWLSGTHLPPEVMPRRLRFTKGKAMYDWLVMRGGGILISSQFKDAVEELDPGRHQFFPVAIEDTKGAVLSGDFFVFNVVGRIDSIIADQSNLKPNGRGQVANWGYGRGVGPWRCALNAAVIGGRACWVEHRFAQAGSFPSDWPRR